MVEDPESLPLRDIHLPDPISWWPPAPGWWAIAMLAAAAALLVHFLVRRYRAGRLLRESRRSLSWIREQYRVDGDSIRLAGGLSELLRRVAISRFPRARVAGLTGGAWLRMLDRIGRVTEFEDGPGRALVDAPYRRDGEVDPAALLQLCERWLRTAARAK